MPPPTRARNARRSKAGLTSVLQSRARPPRRPRGSACKHCSGQRLPSIASAIVWREGFGSASSRRMRVHDHPGCAVAHWKPPCSTNACCSGCSVPSRASPSMVVTSFPSTSLSEVRQERTAVRSTTTVHEPQSPTPQPYLVPVSPGPCAGPEQRPAVVVSRTVGFPFSGNGWASSSGASFRNEPKRRRDYPPSPLPASARGRRRQGAATRSGVSVTGRAGRVERLPAAALNRPSGRGSRPAAPGSSRCRTSSSRSRPVEIGHAVGGQVRDADLQLVPSRATGLRGRAGNAAQQHARSRPLRRTRALCATFRDRAARPRPRCGRGKAIVYCAVPETPGRLAAEAGPGPSVSVRTSPGSCGPPSTKRTRQDPVMALRRPDGSCSARRGPLAGVVLASKRSDSPGASRRQLIPVSLAARVRR